MFHWDFEGFLISKDMKDCCLDGAVEAIEHLFSEDLLLRFFNGIKLLPGIAVEIELVVFVIRNDLDWSENLSAIHREDEICFLPLQHIYIKLFFQIISFDFFPFKKH